MLKGAIRPEDRQIEIHGSIFARSILSNDRLPFVRCMQTEPLNPYESPREAAESAEAIYRAAARTFVRCGKEALTCQSLP